MLRISSILSILFYLTVTIGVHVDVDTCCKSIAGLSFITDSDNHNQTHESDCCSSEGLPTCHPMDSQNPQGCPSDCLFIQVLQDTPPAFSYSEIVPIPLDIEQVYAYLIAVDATPIKEVEVSTYVAPALLPIDDKLYLVQGSHLTYG